MSNPTGINQYTKGGRKIALAENRLRKANLGVKKADKRLTKQLDRSIAGHGSQLKSRSASANVRRAGNTKHAARKAVANLGGKW